METIIKSYTDIEQSKKLAKILPLESADMSFNTHNNMPPLMTSYSRFKEFFNIDPTPAFLIPCWSLAALLDVLPEYNLQRTDWYYKIEHKIVVTTTKDNYASKNYDNPVDACVDMIEKLHELKML